MGHAIDPLLIELSADATWVAEERVPLGPWLLRANHGYTGRANSVRMACAEANRPSADSLLKLIAEAEAFYRQRKLPPIFQISPVTMPRDLDRILVDRGYGISHSGELWSADPVEVRKATAHSGSPGRIVEQTSLERNWLECAWDEHAGQPEMRDGIYNRTPMPRVFATVVEQDKPAARVLGTISGGIGWVYRMASEPAYQRRGYATWLLNMLAEWTLANGGKSLCLQVMADNTAARKLYEKAGFRKEYDYHYRILG